MRALYGFAFAVFGVVTLTLAVVIGAPTFPAWAGIAGVFSILAGVAVWRAR